MSWMLCKDCALPINTDDQPESMIEITDEQGRPDWICLCEDCAYEREIARQDDWQDEEEYGQD